MLEDAHWIDPTTLELVEQALDRGATAPVLLLLTSRPENQPTLAGHPHVTRLTLNRLGRTGVEAIVERLSSGTVLPIEVIDTIIARTDGVPLFVEELTKAVIESGDASVPASLHDSLMSRLDRLPEVKEVAQIAAVIGREFDHAALTAIADYSPDALDGALDRLAAAELVFRRGTPPDASYTFKHALVRDAAYESLLKSRRVALHARLVEVLESQGNAAAEVKAQHAQAAGMTERAVHYWEQAGQQAVARSANREAISHLTSGLSIIESLPDTAERDSHELALLSALAPALMAVKGYAGPEVAPTLARARELCLEAGDDAALFPVLWQSWLLHMTRAEHQRAEALALECLVLADAGTDEVLSLQGTVSVGMSNLYLGRLANSQRYLKRTVSLYEPAKHGQLGRRYGGVDPGALAMGYQAALLWLLGYPEQGERLAADMVSLAERLGQPYTLARSLYWSTIFHHLRRDWTTIVTQADAMIRVADEYGFAMVSALGPFMRASARIEQGADDDAMAELPRGLDGYAATGARMQRPHLLSMVARAHLRLGRPTESLDLLEEALTLATSTGERYVVAELHRLRAECLLAGPRPDATTAAGELLQALEIARDQQARSLELRTARDLARLWAERGERQQALDLLAPVYDWFTEGFDTPDLVEAKVLLEELR